MSEGIIVIDNTEYELLPPPEFSKYKITKLTPKIKFESEGGYFHQREKFSTSMYKIEVGSENISDAQKEYLDTFISYIGSDTFWYIVPTSMTPKSDGKVYPIGFLCKIVNEEIINSPTNPNYWNFSLELRSIGEPIVIPKEEESEVDRHTDDNESGPFYFITEDGDYLVSEEEEYFITDLEDIFYYRRKR